MCIIRIHPHISTSLTNQSKQKKTVTVVQRLAVLAQPPGGSSTNPENSV